MDKKELILLALFFSSFSMLAQVNWTAHFGARIGATIQLGKPVNRLGVVFNAFSNYDFVQLNLEWRGHYNFTNFGPPKSGWEQQLTTGLTFAAGEKTTEENQFLQPYFQQTRRKYAISYAIKFYQDQVETSQRTGILALQFNRVHLVIENDAFGSFHGGDEFRTGAIALFYQDQKNLYELKSVLWTGITNGENTCTFKDTSYPCRFGYRDISGSKYGSFSHGVLAAQVHRRLDYGQVAQIGLGMDSERIRNFLQNKIIHDMYFFPARWTKVRNLHIPMLDENGEAYIFQDWQKIRTATWYLNFGLNGEGFY